jgi:hypothetical protein
VSHDDKLTFYTNNYGVTTCPEVEYKVVMEMLMEGGSGFEKGEALVPGQRSACCHEGCETLSQKRFRDSETWSHCETRFRLEVVSTHSDV